MTSVLKKIRSLSRGGTLPSDSDVSGPEGPVTYEGKLTMPGPVALQSTEYWCKLIGDKLFYYKNSQNTPGCIDINQAQCVRRSSPRSKGFGIKIVTSRGRSMSLVASKEEEREMWLQTLLHTVGTCSERRASIQHSDSDAAKDVQVLQQRSEANGGGGGDHSHSSDDDNELFHQKPDDCHKQISNKQRPQLERMPRIQTSDDSEDIPTAPGKIATSYEQVHIGGPPPSKGSPSLPISEAYEDIVLPPRTSTVHSSRDSGYSDAKNESGEAKYEEVFIPANPKIEEVISKDEGLGSTSRSDQVEYSVPSKVRASHSQGQGHTQQCDVSCDDVVVMRRQSRQPSRADSTSDIFLPTTVTKPAAIAEDSAPNKDDERETVRETSSSDVISKQLSRLVSEVKASSSSKQHELRHSLADAALANSHLDQLKLLLAGGESCQGHGTPDPSRVSSRLLTEAGNTAGVDDTTVSQLKNFLLELDD